MKGLSIGAVVVIALSSPAMAASPDQAATELSTEIMSPFCPGVTLHECPSAEALRLRDRIESWFRDGMQRDEILDRLENEYGRGIRAVPSTKGMGLTAWLVAGAGLIVALGTGVFLLRRWSGRSDTDTEGRPVVTTAEHLRVEDELARLRTQQ